MRPLFFAPVVVAMLAGPAVATMAKLTPLPSATTPQSCRQWASAQDDDAKYMWGLMESGAVSDDVAILRLTLNCMGDPAPAIVGFGSSAGAAKEFCQTHRRAPVCRQNKD